MIALGLACLVLPLLWPDVFFPLTWGSLVFLLEPWNRRHARRSFLRDLEAGEAGPFLRTLLAGLICGEPNDIPFDGIPFPAAPLGLRSGHTWALPLAGAYYKILDWLT